MQRSSPEGLCDITWAVHVMGPHNLLLGQITTEQFTFLYQFVHIEKGFKEQGSLIFVSIQVANSACSGMIVLLLCSTAPCSRCRNSHFASCLALPCVMLCAATCCAQWNFRGRARSNCHRAAYLFWTGNLLLKAYKTRRTTDLCSGSFQGELPSWPNSWAALVHLQIETQSKCSWRATGLSCEHVSWRAVAFTTCCR